MNPYLQNAIMSVITGIMASATFILSLQPTDTRDFVVIVANGIVAGGGAFLTGWRQLGLTPPEK